MRCELKKIGFFHYGDEMADPAESLRACFEETSKNTAVSDCVIVLPEAFNVRGGYWGVDRTIDHSIADALGELASDFGVALLAGLIDEGRDGSRGYSSAYLFDGAERRLLTRKMADDGSKNYTPFGDDCDTPIRHRGVCLASLICMDAADFNSPLTDRHATLLVRMMAHPASVSVLCIPARMQSYGSKEIAEAWPSHLTVVVANSGCSRPSVIRPGDADAYCFGEAKNKLAVIPFR
jgi:predicted amidohydrolase